MLISLYGMVIGYALDLMWADESIFTHPVIIIGKAIDFLYRKFLLIFPSSKRGKRLAGFCLWVIVVSLSFLTPFFILHIANSINIYLRLIVESLMCRQIFATKSLSDSAMDIYHRLNRGDIVSSRRALSMIVGRDTYELSEESICRATVETVSENLSDAVIAPMIYICIGGAPLGFLYKAVNTIDSMIGYTDEPYKDIGYFGAKMDDVFNFLPSRIAALFMYVSGYFMSLDTKNGKKIFLRDRYNHPSPNSAQTESICAGLLGIRLGGNSTYRGILHEKKWIGDETKKISKDDIALSAKLLLVTAIVSIYIMSVVKILCIKFVI